MHTADAWEGGLAMEYDETLEEMWRIKREIASDYFKGMLAYQEEERKKGVKFVSFPPKRIDEDPLPLASSVAECPPPPYQA